MSGSAFRANIGCAAETFRLLRGEPRLYIKTADSGAKRAMAFCPKCGSQIYSCAIERPAPYSLRSGTLRQRAELRPARQIWMRSAMPWAQSFDIQSFDGEPSQR
jgi:hypothetical protein